MRPVLGALRDLCLKREDLEQEAMVIYYELSGILVARSYLACDYFDAKLLEFTALAARIKAQEAHQAQLLAQLQVSPFNLTYVTCASF